MEIVVPIMPKTLVEVDMLNASHYKDADIIEWRADFLPMTDLDKAAKRIKKLFSDQEIIFTFRTEDKTTTVISEVKYAELIEKFSAIFTYVDVEVFKFKHVNLPKNTIASYHDFNQIPDNLPDLLTNMSDKQPKVIKFAGMPQTKSDVIRLMAETLKFSNAHQGQKVVTMAMGELGKLSRVSGDYYGSSWSFAAVSEGSAPGQLTLEEMLVVKNIL